MAKKKELTLNEKIDQVLESIDTTRDNQVGVFKAYISAVHGLRHKMDKFKYVDLVTRIKFINERLLIGAMVRNIDNYSFNDKDKIELKLDMETSSSVQLNLYYITSNDARFNLLNNKDVEFFNEYIKGRVLKEEDMNLIKAKTNTKEVEEKLDKIFELIADRYIEKFMSK